MKLRITWIDIYVRKLEMHFSLENFGGIDQLGGERGGKHSHGS